MLNREVCLIRDARVDPRVHDSAFAHVWVFYAGAPLTFEGERVGVLCVGDTNPRDFDAAAMDALSDLAALAEHELQVAALSESQIALALSAAELEMSARIDVLTHVWNRRAIFQIAKDELANNGGSPVAVLLIDLDRFKEVNDRYGHPARISGAEEGRKGAAPGRNCASMPPVCRRSGAAEGRAKAGNPPAWPAGPAPLRGGKRRCRRWIRRTSSPAGVAPAGTRYILAAATRS